MSSILDTTVAPWKFVGKLKLASGVLVGESYVLTAGHVGPFDSNGLAGLLVPFGSTLVDFGGIAGVDFSSADEIGVPSVGGPSGISRIRGRKQDASGQKCRQANLSPRTPAGAKSTVRENEQRYPVAG
jgi:hypothetical protein